MEVVARDGTEALRSLLQSLLEMFSLVLTVLNRDYGTPYPYEGLFI